MSDKTLDKMSVTVVNAYCMPISMMEQSHSVTFDVMGEEYLVTIAIAVGDVPKERGMTLHKLTRTVTPHDGEILSSLFVWAQENTDRLITLSQGDVIEVDAIAALCRKDHRQKQRDIFNENIRKVNESPTAPQPRRRFPKPPQP